MNEITADCKIKDAMGKFAKMLMALAAMEGDDGYSITISIIGPHPTPEIEKLAEAVASTRS